jgi:hypothetical protein
MRTHERCADLATIRTQITALCAAITAAHRGGGSRKSTAARLPRRRVLPARRRTCCGLVPAAISFLVPPGIACVMLIAAQGGQAMFVEVSVMERGNLGSPQEAAPVLRSAPEASSSKSRDLPGW